MNEAPRRLVRTRNDRVFGGVCGGLGRYFNIDPAIFRIATVVIAFVGGAGILAYFVAWLVVPREDAPGEPGQPQSGWTIAVLVIAAVLFGLPILVAISFSFGALLLPLVLFVVAALLVWWLVSGDGPTGSAGDVAKWTVFGSIVIVCCGLVALAGAWATAAGGETAAAILVIATGVAILVGAFVRPMRWLVLPAVILALSAATVAAADIDLDGGVGDESYRPTSVSQLRDRYELGVGELVLDLTRVDFPSGGQVPVEVDVGVGSALVRLPDSDVCAGLEAKVGVGEARLYQRSNGGVDVDFEEVPEASTATPRVLIRGDVGVGEIRVTGSGAGGGGFDANRRCLDGAGRAAR